MNKKNHFKVLVLTGLAAFSMSLASFADETAPLWTCNIAFTGEAEGVQIIIGKFEIDGQGDLNCISPAGDTYQAPVTIEMGSSPIAARIALGKFDVVGQSLNVSLLTGSPENLLGTYLVGHAQGAIVAGVGAVTGVHADFPEVGITINLQVLRGFGVNVGMSRLRISLDRSRM